MASELPDPSREAVLAHVLREVYPDRLEAEIAGTVPVEPGTLVGVKVLPRGYLSTAKYALVTVDAGRILDTKTCSGREVRRAVGEV